VLVSNSVIDTCRVNLVKIDGSPTPTFFGNLNFTANHLITTVDGTASTAMINIEGSYLTGQLNFSSNEIGNGQNDVFYILNGKYINISNNMISDGNQANASGVGLDLVNISNSTITGNTIGNTGTPARQVYGLSLGGTVSNLVFIENTFFANTSASINNVATITNSVISNNGTVDTSSALITAAATITLPATMVPNITIGGASTTINTLNGAWSTGQTVYMNCQNSQTISAAGNFERASTCAAGQTLTLKWNLQGTSKWDY
jgi:hypothetical protein